MITRNIKKIFSRIIDSNKSELIEDAHLLKKFTQDPEFPYLVSFPRTGSHWLRMVMELYFEKPSLVRAFYYPRATDFTCYHTHDVDLELCRENVIYLHRNPVETVYSQLHYHKEDPRDQVRRLHWISLYARHLLKWLVNEKFTHRKTIITYEGMRSDIYAEFEKVCEHFNQRLDRRKLGLVLAQVTKANLRKKTKHDRQVVNLTNTYQENRMHFIERYSEEIYRELHNAAEGLSDWIKTV